MLKKKEINILREKLNNSIIENKDYNEIYKISTKLDGLIAEYYRENKSKKVKRAYN